MAFIFELVGVTACGNSSPAAPLNRHRQCVYCSTDNCHIGGIDNGCLLGRVGRAVPSHPDSAAAGIGHLIGTRNLRRPTARRAQRRVR